MARIDDPADARLTDYLHLTDAAARRRGDVFFCEGTLAIRRALECGIELDSLLVTPAKRAQLADVLAGREVEVYEAELDVLRVVTGFDIHRGAIAAARRPRSATLAEVLPGATTVAVLEGINDLENLGALFRNAAAFGIDAVLLDPTTADPLSRRSVRVSLGHVLSVPHVRVAAWPEPLDDLADFEVLALTPGGEEAPIPTDGRVAFLLGAEGPGLSDAALARADRRIRIPIAPGVDSLNVATAAAIAFHHRFS